MDDEQAQEIATRAALRAGRLAMARLDEPGYLSWKGHRDVVAGASLDVQADIVSFLQRECPGDAILAEEGPEEEPLAADAERLWVVDPICGSLNFAAGIPFFAVSLALRVAGLLRVGVVYDPARDELFAGRFGAGATLNGRLINVRTQSLGPEFWAQSWIGTDLPPSGPRRETALRLFNFYSSEVMHQTVMGSPALGLCYVACGRLHVYWNLDAKPWDVAAAGVIVEEAGGLINDVDGGPWIHSHGGYVAGVPTLVAWALQGLMAVQGEGPRPQQEAAADRPPPL